MQKHSFFACPAGAPEPCHPALDDLESVPTWLRFDHDGLIRRQLEGRPELHLQYEGLELRLQLDPFRRLALREVDGARTLGDILPRCPLSEAHSARTPAKVARSRRGVGGLQPARRLAEARFALNLAAEKSSGSRGASGGASSITAGACDPRPRSQPSAVRSCAGTYARRANTTPA